MLDHHKRNEENTNKCPIIVRIKQHNWGNCKQSVQMGNGTITQNMQRSSKIPCNQVAHISQTHGQFIAYQAEEKNEERVLYLYICASTNILPYSAYMKYYESNYDFRIRELSTATATCSYKLIETLKAHAWSQLLFTTWRYTLITYL